MLADKKRNPPLIINAHVFDVKTDKKESSKVYNIRRPSVNRNIASNKQMLEDYEMQRNEVDKKFKSMIDLVIWAANNGRSVEFVAKGDDNEDD